MLKEPGTCESLEAGAAALLFEALFACHHRDRLHSLAEDSLMILIAGLRPEVLERCLPRLILSLCKMGASSGVRCALVAMKKLPPKRLQLEVLSRGFGHRTREGALQILMACTRLYPRQDVEVVRIAEFAALALRDRRRRVRQAALETLAAAAQLSSVHETLNVVESAIKDFGDFGEIIQVVRTRLSRKQLPTVDLDGSIRYTSPIDQNESHWITGSVLKGNVSPSPISSASSSNTSANYWMHNLRHEHNFNSGAMRIRQLSEANEEDVFDDSCKIWTPDASNCDTLKAANGSKAGVLRPVYILQPESATENGKHSRGYRKYDRGRSFSPPKHFKGHFPAGLVDPVPIIPVHSNTNGTDKHYSAPDAYSRLQYPADSRLQQGFRKSFFSDQLYSNDRLPSKYEPQSLSLSSRSSSTSTGSSTKSGFWYRDLKSGIPLPIAESKLKIRHSTSSSITSNGPLIAKRSITNSPQHTPGSSKPSPRPQTHVGDHESISHLSLPPPLSSGSETSGYYTPSPPDTYPPAFIKMDTEERPSSDAEEPIEQLDSRSNKSVLNEDGQSPGPGSRIGSAQPTNHFLGEPIHDNYPSVESIQLNNNEEVAQSRPPSHQLLLQSIPEKIEIRRKSKSVIDLPNFLPQIAPIRKNVNSAPPRNEDNVLNNNPEPDATDPLPPMVDAGQHQEVTESQQSSAVVRKSKLERRRLSRNDSRKTLKASPRAAAESSIAKPPNKPKDVLQHVLTQLGDPNWEATVEGLQGLIKLLKQSPDTVLQQIHQICIVLAKHIKNLRSQVARVACNTASELFLTCRRALDMELEDIAIPLLQRTADTNRFLRADANATLDVMCEHLPTHRVIPVVAARGCAHPNSVVRAASVRLLGDLVRRLGAERVFYMPKELRDKLLLAGANALADGNVEARSHGKSMLKHLVEHPNFQRNLREAVPQNILRHISKVLATIKPDA
uniref:TOG domain-containing protein n=1 Tax=Dendroctonus ponderosae TaxID=77166 RepID=A0AAR5PK58_DENPD